LPVPARFGELIGAIALRPSRELRAIPYIEGCAFGAIRAWTGHLNASNEIGRVDFDATMIAMALTAKEMNANTEIPRKVGSPCR
jgi:hypothetical protein